LAYLFKLRLTANVKRMIERLTTQREWTNAGQGWQAKESLLRLEGGSRQRRVIILRRRGKGGLAVSSNEKSGQQTLSFVDVGAGVDVYEYSVLATSLDEELVSFGQLYRDRGDSENIFDELKNQWGWGGFVTQDLARCRLAARMIALFYDWWSIFVRLVEPDRHMEAITSRPLLLYAIATRVRHARQTTITVASSHARAIPAAKAFRAVAIFLRGLAKNAEQLTGLQRWRRILARGKSLPSFPSGPSVALAATPRARLTQQLLVEKSQKSAARPTPTAGFRITAPVCLCRFGLSVVRRRMRLSGGRPATRK